MHDEKKTGKERTQPATRNEEWSDERVRSFLSVQIPDNVPADYHLLAKAYRSMLPEQFARFVAFFVAEGHDINVRLDNGSTFMDQLLQHRRAVPYIDIIKEHGAVSGQSAQH